MDVKGGGGVWRVEVDSKKIDSWNKKKTDKNVLEW